MKSVFRLMGVAGSFVGALLTTASLVAPAHAGTVTFGSGANQFNMEFVTIGNPGNAADTTGSPNPAGAVGYTYGIGKFEVSRDMIEKFNASQLFQLQMDDMTSVGGNGANKPATGVSWNEAARFINWLNTSTGSFAAYKFSTSGVNDNIAIWTAADTNDYDPLNPYRSKRTRYVLPSIDEWYKAAYYDPLNNDYYDFPTGSNSAPTAVPSGSTANTAVYSQTFEQGPADVSQAGGLSPYGVRGLGGNVNELLETELNQRNDDPTSSRFTRGGGWSDGSYFLQSYSGSSLNPDFGIGTYYGFRVASLPSSAPPAVPEPSMMVIGTLFGLGGLVAKRRMKK